MINPSPRTSSDRVTKIKPRAGLRDVTKNSSRAEPDWPPQAYGIDDLHLADLTAYVKTQEAVGMLYADQEAWARKAIVNVASSGPFSSDRTIRQYAEEIWGAKSVPVG